MLDWMLLGIGVTIPLLTLLAALLLSSQDDSRPEAASSLASLLSGWERSPLPLLGLLLSLGIIVAFTMSPRLENTITLPIEVIGADGHTEAVTVDVANPTEVDRLYIKGHKLGYHKSSYAESNGYDKKASFRINGGAWVPIDNSTFSAKYPESEYYSGQLSGPIGGPWSVLRGTLPISNTGALQAGANTIEFRFNGTEGMSSGYRVLELDLQTSGGSSRIDGTSFDQADPDTWEAPNTSSTAIQEGSEYWNARNTLLDEPGGETIVAACADCHAQDGRDLKYFNFSNKSIITRAEFHGLSTEKGRKIASYIRTRELNLPSGYTVADAGRPWNPPYQPGPGLKDEPVELWAAGAGMKWVLDDDMDTYPLLFPSSSDRTTLRSLNGVPDDPDRFLASLEGTRNQNQMLRRTHTDSTINMDEIPIAKPLPDIFEWWPDVHPADFLPGGESAFNDSKWVASYERWRSEMEKGRSHIDALAQETSERIDDGDYWQAGLMGLGIDFTMNWSLSDWEWPSGWEDTVSDDLLRQKLSFEQWRAIKTWEIMQEFNLQDYGDEMFTNNPNDLRVGGKDRTWFIETSLYDVAPHKNGKPGYPDYGAFATKCQNVYFSTSWYEVAAILNTGNRLGSANSPFDWNYHHTHIGDHVNCYGHTQPLRYMKAQILVQQQRANFRGVTGSPRGWSDWHVISPQRALATGGKASFMSEALPNELRLDIAESIIRAHTIETLRYDVDDFPRGSGESLRTESYTPQLQPELGLGWPNRSDAQYTMTAMLAEAGGSRATLADSMARWGEKLWPNGDWEQWMITGNRAPSVSLTDPSDGSAVSAPGPASLAANASDPDGSINKVTFYQGTTALGEDTSAPFEYSWGDLSPGTYYLTAKATDDAGETTTSASHELTVTATDTPPSGVTYSYHEGQWSELPNFEQEPIVKTGTTSGFGLSMRNRDDEFALRYTTFIKVPSSDTGTYTFYTASDDGSRLLVNGQEVVNNDGLHAVQERSGTLSLDAGWHKVVVEYFEDTGGQDLSVSWEGPSFSQQSIPSDRLHLAPGATQSTQSVVLNPGWNVISSYVQPSSPALDSVFADVSVVIAKDENGDTYIPSYDLNDIGDWKALDAYKVYTETEQSLTLNGTAVDATATIPLEEGWNLIPYLPRDAQEVATALQSIEQELVIAKDEAGNAYIPSYGIDEIGQLAPGEGYQVYVESPVDLVYPDASTSTTASHSSTSRARPQGTDGK